MDEGLWAWRWQQVPELNTGGCRLATFHSRSRKGRWCKGESSGHFMKVGVLMCHLIVL